MTPDLFCELQRIISLREADRKCEATRKLACNWQDLPRPHNSEISEIAQPGLPPELTLVQPGKLKRRGLAMQSGRNVLMHAIAHIEFNAINLALDAAYRFRNLPLEYYGDWLQIAADEARHFGLIRTYLNKHDCEYGDYPAHNGLWDMARQTATDVVARMALVPRVLEARGLDVTPAMIKRLTNAGDLAAVEILQTIYEDEITHVERGSHWFRYVCAQQGLEPRATFTKMVAQHLHGQMKGPFNLAARLQAGFDEAELRALTEGV
ncbi:MAG: ferritin-like domain-containing protein [Gammaproteobacteria bacterium]|nr:ferritin-like domain-containing protein [Gammaproteobacteria bacterium]